METMRRKGLLLLVVTAMVSCCGTQGYPQDARNVTEPRIPQSCATLTASLQSSEGKLASSDESRLDTERIQAALDSCAPGKAVELSPGLIGTPSYRERCSCAPELRCSSMPASFCLPLEIRETTTLAWARAVLSAQLAADAVH